MALWGQEAARVQGTVCHSLKTMMCVRSQCRGYRKQDCHPNIRTSLNSDTSSVCALGTTGTQRKERPIQKCDLGAQNEHEDPG